MSEQAWQDRAEKIASCLFWIGEVLLVVGILSRMGLVCVIGAACVCAGLFHIVRQI